MKKINRVEFNSTVFFENIDWKLLKEQKEVLVGLTQSEKMLGKIITNALTGILHLVDTVQDFAVDEMGIPEEQVFSISNVDNEELPQSKPTIFAYNLKDLKKQSETLMVLIKISETPEFFGGELTQLIGSDLITLSILMRVVKDNPEFIGEFDWESVRRVKETVLNLYNLPETSEVFGELLSELIKADLLGLLNYITELQDYAVRDLKLDAFKVFG